jgi:hypothetical protein
MTHADNGAIASKAFASLTEDDILESLIEHQITGTLDSGGRFFGNLEGYDQYRLFIRGNRGQRILIKRKYVARLEAL